MKSVQVALCMLGMLAGLCIAPRSAYAAEDEARVLILNALDPYLPAYVEIDSAMRASLVNETTRHIVLYSEPLDAQRFPLGLTEPEIVSLLAKKYNALHIDVVVTITQAALDFFKRHGKQLWPGARLVFDGIPDSVDVTLSLPPNAAGLVHKDDFAGTIDLARRLQPNAHRILVIAGAASLDLEHEWLARQLLPAMAGTATVEFLSGRPLQELSARVASESADTIVLYLTQFRDREDRPYVPRDVLRVISSTSAAPVYGFFETYVGYGIAAGSMESYEERGRLVGQLVREALTDRSSAHDPVVFAVPSRCVADAREMKRWSLDAAKLPGGCDIRFADRPIWRRYLWQSVVALAIIVGQTLLIVALFVQRRRRRVAEQAVQRHRSEVAHASRLAIAGQLTASIAHEINQPLGAILSNAETADLLLQSGEDQRDLLRHILADIRCDDLRASEVIRRLRELLAKHEIEQKPIDLNATVTEVGAMLQGEAERRRVTIEMRLAPVVTMVGDRIQIQQVLLNLLLNAMDAVADAGEERRTITVSVENVEHRIMITVRDHGHGIPLGELPKVFDSFYSTKRAGMGLGLSIARTIVEANGGRIWAESVPGDGAAFHIEFPAMESTAKGPRTEDTT